MKNDLRMMKEALLLANTSRLLAPPNPWVGCIIVQGDQIVGQGATSKPGGPHAEINALHQAGPRAAGSTLYVTLEPCCHRNKRTPPCTEAIIKSQVKRVVIGMQDPDAHVNGKGIEQLQQAGITVTTDVLTSAIEISLLPYLHHRRKCMPWVVGKCAQSLDGKIAASDGTSQWISSLDARQNSQQLRAESQAILIGAKTAIHDNPRLTVRSANLKPLRILIDAKALMPLTGHLFDKDLGPLLIATSEGTNTESFQQAGISTLQLPNLAGGDLDLRPLLYYLGKQGVLQLLVEGGGYTLGAFLKQNCLNALTMYQAPILLGQKGLAAFQGLDIGTLTQATRFQLICHQVLGDTIRLDYALG
jgi:diaminohydroxyphosphoribosylaminopyrimidine deaminase/5-amino-6-(5-phosphoribosylamino)uracil reductase